MSSAWAVATNPESPIVPIAKPFLMRRSKLELGLIQPQAFLPFCCGFVFLVMVVPQAIVADI